LLFLAFSIFRFDISSNFFGSRSSIYDFINPELPANQRVIPLHGRNQDKVAFQYGVFLLNKNLAQLRCDCGTFTQDLRCTLANLRSLFDHLADAKLEPYLYITRAMRVMDGAGDDTASAASSLRRQSPSTSSGALSTDSGEPSFRLELPPSKLSIVASSSNVPTATDEDEPKGNFVLKAPIYSPDRRKLGATNNNDSEDSAHRSNADLTPILQDDYAYKFTAENSNGNVNMALNKELLRTCYLTADDDGQFSQHRDREDFSENGARGTNFENYLPPASCRSD